MAVTAVIGRARPNLFQMIKKIGAEANLDFCVDAGARASYDGGQIWADLTGQSNDFFLGQTDADNTNDPAFNGTIGRKTSAEFFRADDNNDIFMPTAAHTFADEWHKNNAAWTVFAVVRSSSLSQQTIFTTWTAPGPSGDPVGVRLLLAGGDLWVDVRNNTFLFTMQAITPGAQIAVDTWHFVACSLNEATGANGCILKVDTTDNLFTSTYPAPSALDRDNVQIGPFLSDLDIAMIGGASRAWSASELNALYAMIKAERFPALP